MNVNRLLPATAMLKHVLPMYQPIINVPNRSIVAFEALARCTHPRWQGVSPQVFIPIARRGGMLDEMTVRICEQAAQDRPMLEAININVELSQLADTQLVDRVVNVFSLTSSDLLGITFEITEESNADVNYADAVRGIDRLKKLGAQLALDDFGNGHSNFERLCELPVDILKIPRNLIYEMAGGDKNLACIRATLSLAETLGLKTVAEGVDNFFQIYALKQMGCMTVQGFWYSRPLTLNDAIAFKREHLVAGRAP